MEISEIESMRLVGPREHVLGGGSGTISKTIVRVEADDGTYGLGEAEDWVGIEDSIQYISGVLEGRDPMAVKPHVSEIVFRTLPPPTQEQQRLLENPPSGITPVPATSPTGTPNGPITWAISAVEMALCDLIGKALGTPVYNLLGGAFRKDVKVYLDRSSPRAKDNLDSWRKMARDSVTGEFNFIKFDIDHTAPDYTLDPWNRSLSTAQLNRIVERIRAVREAIGPDAELAVDCHWQLSRASALRLADELSDLDILWFEDPGPITDPETYRRVSTEANIPVCAGEMFIPTQFRQFIERDAYDIVHPDVLFAGGLHATHRIAEYAELHSLPVALHGNGGALATIAAAHVAAASRNFIGLEYRYFPIEVSAGR